MVDAMRVCRHSDAAKFLERAEDWLLRSEAEHNLVLGITRRQRGSTSDSDPPNYFATIEDDDGVVGCAFRTPPHKIGMTRVPPAAIPLLLEDVAEVYETLPAVMGPEREAKLFARLWASQHGVTARAGMRLRIYQLKEVQPLDGSPGGFFRQAECDEGLA